MKKTREAANQYDADFVYGATLPQKSLGKATDPMLTARNKPVPVRRLRTFETGAMVHNVVDALGVVIGVDGLAAASTLLGHGDV